MLLPLAFRYRPEIQRKGIQRPPLFPAKIIHQDAPYLAMQKKGKAQTEIDNSSMVLHLTLANPFSNPFLWFFRWL